MKFMSRSLLIPSTAAILILSACNTPAASTGTAQPSSSDSRIPVITVAPAAANGLDACTLLTKTDAETILGQAVNDPEIPIQGNETFNVTSCKYQVQGGTALDKVSLIVTVPANGDMQSAQIAYDTDKSTAQNTLGAAPVDVPGVGDSAFWVGGYGNQLAILKGNVHLILSASNYKGDAPPQPVIDLAQTILGRLP